METKGRWLPVWDALPYVQTTPYPFPPGRRYLLPCHLLCYGGLYEYVLIDVAQGRNWLLAGPCVSFLTHPFLHAAFERLMGFLTPPGAKKPLPALGYHDDALVFLVEGYETLPSLARGDSRKVKQIVEDGHYTLGLLRRLA